MTTIQQLGREATRMRNEMAVALDVLRARLTVRGLAEEAVTCLTPYRSRVVPVYEAVKRHPMLAAALLAGAGWLLNDGRKSKSVKRSQRRKRKP